MAAKITVIVPVFNSELYLTKCLDSILNQSYKNLEIILVNDGSKDQSGVICDNYSKLDRRIIVVHTENFGPSSARNLGLELAGGEWITFVDSDDYIEPDLCQYLLNLAQEYDADLVQSCAIQERAVHFQTIFRLRKDTILKRGIEDFTPEIWRRFGNPNWGKLYRREMIGEARFDVSCRVGEDLHFNLQVLMRAQRIVLGSEAKYHYVLTEGSLFRTVPSRDRLLDCRRMLERAQKEFCENPAISERIMNEQYRNDLDICSKIVCFHLKSEEDIREFIRNEIREHIRMLTVSRWFSKREKLKFLLIVYAWPVYCRLLLWSKHRQKGRMDS